MENQSPLRQKKVSNKRKSVKQVDNLEEEILQQSQYKQQIIEIANTYFPSITVPIPINDSIKPKNSTKEVPIQTVDDYISQVCNILPQPTSFDHNQFLFTMQTMVMTQLNYAQEFQEKQSKTKTTTNNNKSNKSKRVKQNSQQSKKDLDAQSMTTINKSDDDSLDQFQSQNPRNLSQLDSMETLDNDHQNDCGKFSPQSQKTQQLFESPLDSPKKCDEIDSYINELDDYYHQMPLKKKKSCFDDEITEKFLNIPDNIDLNFNDNLNEGY